ncbi:hypothetical protein TNCV_3213131 [Trichonephila clavipes]|nr:hypothetical protein TNCV_3213131 [Trichonephila clavipes]
MAKFTEFISESLHTYIIAQTQLLVSKIQIEINGIHRGKELDVRNSLSIALSNIEVIARFGSVPHQEFEGKHSGGNHGLPTLHPTTNLRGGFANTSASQCGLYRPVIPVNPKVVYTDPQASMAICKLFMSETK